MFLDRNHKEIATRCDLQDGKKESFVGLLTEEIDLWKKIIEMS
jgi:hypothetical protein